MKNLFAFLIMIFVDRFLSFIVASLFDFFFSVRMFVDRFPVQVIATNLPLISRRSRKKESTLFILRIFYRSFYSFIYRQFLNLVKLIFLHDDFHVKNIFTDIDSIMIRISYDRVCITSNSKEKDFCKLGEGS